MYSRLDYELNQFLNTFEISTHTCDVFEEVVLELASIKTKPIKSQFGAVSEDIMFFKIKGITDEDAKNFLNFLERSGDPRVRRDYIPIPPDRRYPIPDELYGAHIFYVSTETVYYKIFPYFKRRIVGINEDPTERFKTYKALSEDDHDVKVYKLTVLIDGILKQMSDIERTCVDNLSKGELHIIFKLLEGRLRLYKEHLPHECGRFANEVREKIALFEETLNENTFLQQDKGTIDLYQDLNKIRNSAPIPLASSLQTFGVFNCSQHQPDTRSSHDEKHKIDYRVR